MYKLFWMERDSSVHLGVTDHSFILRRLISLLGMKYCA